MATRSYPYLAMLWNLGPVMAGILMFVFMNVMTMMLSWAQGTFHPGSGQNWLDLRRNTAFTFGDPVLCAGALTAAGYALRSLPAGRYYWFLDGRIQLGLLLGSWGLMAFTEWQGRFHQGLGWSSYQPSDLWHAFAFGPFGACVALGVLASGYAAWTQHTHRWAFAAAVGAVLFWVAMLGLYVRINAPGQAMPPPSGSSYPAPLSTPPLAE